MPDDKTPPAPPVESKKPAPAPEPAATEEPKPNLTRDGIEGTLRAKFIEQGKSVKEATALAKARALEMIPD